MLQSETTELGLEILWRWRATEDVWATTSAIRFVGCPEQSKGDGASHLLDEVIGPPLLSPVPVPIMDVRRHPHRCVGGP